MKSRQANSPRTSTTGRRPGSAVNGTAITPSLSGVYSALPSHTVASVTGRLFSTHIGQSVVEVREMIHRHGVTPVQWAAAQSLLKPGTILAHCILLDEHPQIAGQLGIQSIPAVFAFQRGQPVDGFMGALPESQVKGFIERLVGPMGPSAADELLRGVPAVHVGT